MTNEDVIRKGRKTLADVPARLRADVEALLKARQPGGEAG